MMEYNNYSNNYYNQQQAMGATPYMAQPYMQQPVPSPVFESSLTEDEFKELQSSPAAQFSIVISPKDNLIAKCNHKHNGQDMVRRINDNTGDVYCPICNQRWNPDRVDREELDNLIARLRDAMQNCKWVGDLNTQLTRDYFPIMPLLEKFPDLYDKAMEQFSRYTNQNAYTDANDASVYYQYNTIMGRAPMANQGYGMPFMGQPAYQQPMQAYPYGGQPMQQGYNPAMNTAPVNPAVNPMQAPANTQYTDQNQMMMQGQYYAQPQAQQYPYGQPMQGQPMQPQQGYQPQPNFAPAQPAQAAPADAQANAPVSKDSELVIK